jgi:hypothetical protein
MQGVGGGGVGLSGRGRRMDAAPVSGRKQALFVHEPVAIVSLPSTRTDRRLLCGRAESSPRKATFESTRRERWFGS